jgi:hypothetical protein
MAGPERSDGSGRTAGGLTRRRTIGALAGAVGLGAIGVYGFREFTNDDQTAPSGDVYGASFTSASGNSPTLGVPYEDHPVMGSRDADVLAFEWSDYQCPYCERFDSNTLPELATNEVANGTLAVVFLELPLLGADSLSAGVVSKAVWRTVATSTPDAWGRFHHHVFAQQGPKNGGWASESSLLEYADDVAGVPGDDVRDRVASDRSNLEAAVRADARIAFDGLGLEPGAPLFALAHPDSGRTTAIRGAKPYETFQRVISELRPP